MIPSSAQILWMAFAIKITAYSDFLQKTINADTLLLADIRLIMVFSRFLESPPPAPSNANVAKKKSAFCVFWKSFSLNYSKISIKAVFDPLFLSIHFSTMQT